MIKAGSLLLAQPYLRDPNFKRSAIAIVDQHESGTVGFVLTQPLDWKVDEVMKGFPNHDGQLYKGGPVQEDTLHFLHTLGDEISDSIHVEGDLYWGGDFAQMVILIQSGTATSENVKFFLGYSGWASGQLEEELAGDTWVLSDLTHDLIFSLSFDQIWSKGMRRLGNAFGVISQMDEESLN